VKIGTAKAKNELTMLLRRAEKGESITITRHGHPVAELRRARQRLRLPDPFADVFDGDLKL
jgi:prevent-host-death family protein